MPDPDLIPELIPELIRDVILELIWLRRLRDAPAAGRSRLENFKVLPNLPRSFGL